MAQLALCLQQDAVVDNLERRAMGTLIHILGQGARGNIEPIGILLYCMHLSEALFQQLSKTNESLVCHTRHIELGHLPALTATLYPNQEKPYQIQHIVLMGKSPRQ